jgi:hypothetical protein
MANEWISRPQTLSGKDGDAVLSDQPTLRADRQNTIYGPKDDGTFLVEFRTAEWPCAPRNV